MASIIKPLKNHKKPSLIKVTCIAAGNARILAKRFSTFTRLAPKSINTDDDDHVSQLTPHNPLQTLHFTMAGQDFHPSTGITPPKASPGYSTYKSPYGPKYKIQPNLGGWTAKSFSRLGMTLAGFGGVAGFFAIFFFSEIPRLRKDILQKVPIIGQHFVKEIPPSDNFAINKVIGYVRYCGLD